MIVTVNVILDSMRMELTRAISDHCIAKGDEVKKVVADVIANYDFAGEVRQMAQRELRDMLMSTVRREVSKAVDDCELMTKIRNTAKVLLGGLDQSGG